MCMYNGSVLGTGDGRGRYGGERVRLTEHRQETLPRTPYRDGYGSAACPERAWASESWDNSGHVA